MNFFKMYPLRIHEPYHVNRLLRQGMRIFY